MQEIFVGNIINSILFIIIRYILLLEKSKTKTEQLSCSVLVYLILLLLGFKKFSPVIMLFQVYHSNSFLAFFATCHHCLAGILFSSSHFAFVLSAICLVDNSARLVNINSASVI